MIDSATRSSNDAGTGAAPEIWGRDFLLAGNLEIDVAVAAVMANRIGADVGDADDYGDGLAFEVLLARGEDVDFDLGGCWKGQKEKGGE